MRWPEWIAASAILGPLLLVLVHRLTGRRLRPDWAAPALVVGSLTVAGCTACLLAVLAWAAVARIPFVGGIGAWPSNRVGTVVRFPVGLSWFAAGIGVLLLVNLGRVVASEVSRIRDARATLAGLRPTPAVAVVVDDLPYAYALNGWHRGGRRVIVSTGMIETLPASELECVLAHERVHLERHHAVYQLLCDLAAALNPLLRWTGQDLDFALERWADEAAAESTDRGTVADALLRSALAALDFRVEHPAVRASWGARSVPERLDALLVPPGRSRWMVVAYVVVCGIGMGVMLRALERSEDLVEALQKLR